MDLRGPAKNRLHDYEAGWFIDPSPVFVPALMSELGRFDAAPNLGPTELLAMQGRYLGMPR